MFIPIYLSINVVSTTVPFPWHIWKSLLFHKHSKSSNRVLNKCIEYLVSIGKQLLCNLTLKYFLDIMINVKIIYFHWNYKCLWTVDNTRWCGEAVPEFLFSVHNHWNSLHSFHKMIYIGINRALPAKGFWLKEILYLQIRKDWLS